MSRHVQARVWTTEVDKDSSAVALCQSRSIWLGRLFVRGGPVKGALFDKEAFKAKNRDSRGGSYFLARGEIL